MIFVVRWALSEEAQEKSKCSLLIGMKYATLHPVAISGNEGLVFYKSLFGTGNILGGTYSAFTVSDTINANV